MKYRKKPVVVEAFHYGLDDDPEWFSEKISSNIHLHERPPFGCNIITLEGLLTAYPGDMIIKGIQGEIYPCKKDIFDATYEKVEE